MQKIIWTVMIASLALVGCRKMVLRDVDTDSSDQHCSNFVMDADEIGLDCGGANCAACTQNTAPCTLNSNEMKICTNGFTLSTKTLSNHQLDTSTGNWIYTAETNATDLLSIRFSSKPSVSTVYTGVSDGSFLEPYEAYIVYYQPSTYDLIGSGDVYVNYNAGAYTFTACDYSFHQWGSGTPSFTQTFSVTFN